MSSSLEPLPGARPPHSHVLEETLHGFLPLTRGPAGCTGASEGHGPWPGRRDPRPPLREPGPTRSCSRSRPRGSRCSWCRRWSCRGRCLQHTGMWTGQVGAHHHATSRHAMPRPGLLTAVALTIDAACAGGEGRGSAELAGPFPRPSVGGGSCRRDPAPAHSLSMMAFWMRCTWSRKIALSSLGK